MNLITFRSGGKTYVNAECIKGYAFKPAIAREESAHFYNIAMTATGSSFALAGVVI